MVFCGPQGSGISIHALLTESDVEKVPADVYYQAFLSTLSLRRATVVHALKLADTMLFLSTLSLRRATVDEITYQRQIDHFYPRSPYGERPWQRGSRITYVEISIHALLTESDPLR